MNIRRSAATLAAAAVVLGAAVPAVAAPPAPTPTVAIPDGLYGTADPTYDGVWRQSVALLAQRTTGVTPAAGAVSWLTGQQCANGAFAAFRADPAKGCDAKLMVDTNSTAAAVQALAALGGHEAATDKAVGWLKSVQNADGGWGYTPGGASDANSTSVVAGALTATGQQPAQVKKAGKSPYDALAGLSSRAATRPAAALSRTSRTRRAPSRPTRTPRPRACSASSARGSRRRRASRPRKPTSAATPPSRSPRPRSPATARGTSPRRSAAPAT